VGDIIGSVVGGIGSLFGGNSSDKAVNQAALTGFNYLKGNNLTNQVQNDAVGASQQEGNISNSLLQLLGVQPMTGQTQNGFNNYLNSTGYNFMLDSGSKAITGNAASRGILNSGSTAKALTRYGQDVGTQYFNNYLNQLSGANNVVSNRVNQGLTSTGQMAAAGTTGGGNAASAMTSGNATQGASGFGNMIGKAADLATTFL